MLLLKAQLQSLQIFLPGRGPLNSHHCHRHKGGLPDPPKGSLREDSRVPGGGLQNAADHIGDRGAFASKEGFNSVTAILAKLLIPRLWPNLGCVLCGLKIDIEQVGNGDVAEVQKGFQIDVQGSHFLWTVQLMTTGVSFKRSKKAYLGCTALQVS